MKGVWRLPLKCTGLFASVCNKLRRLFNPNDGLFPRPELFVIPATPSVGALLSLQGPGSSPQSRSFQLFVSHRPPYLRLERDRRTLRPCL